MQGHAHTAGKSLLFALLLWLAVNPLWSQTASDPDNGLNLVYDPVMDTWTMSWWGRAGRTYFLQHSLDLQVWLNLDVIEPGHDAVISYGMTTTAPNNFWRVASVDIIAADPVNADFDADGIGNQDEIIHGTDPLKADTDGDGISDGSEDSDGDGLSDADEFSNGTNPRSADTDGDGLPDGFEDDYSDPLNPSDAQGDFDEDGLTMLQEYQLATDPTSDDTDADGLNDGQEVNVRHTDPRKWDTDGDWLSDGYELTHGTNPLLADTDGNGIPDGSTDTDGDGMTDGYEIRFSLDPEDAADAVEDYDGDELSNLQEFQAGADPHSPDTDGDGLDDDFEVAIGTNPTLVDSDGDWIADGMEDHDGDGIPNGYELAAGMNPLDPADGTLDFDNDGLTNLQEYQLGTDPQVSDSDGDTLPDGVEVQLGRNPLLSDTDGDGTSDGEEDTDGDGIPDGWEANNGLNLMLVNDAQTDTDGDGLSALQEYQQGTSPTRADTDGDGLTDQQEKDLALNPRNWDTDGDNMSDPYEITHGLDATSNTDQSEDPDGDGRTNLQEYRLGTNPRAADTDGDGVNDGTEETSGSDPTNGSDGGVAPTVENSVQVSFLVQSTGKTAVGSCAVCHNLTVQVGNRLLADGEILTLPRGVTKDIKLIDNPTEYPAEGGGFVHDTARFVLWPNPSAGQTLAASSDNKSLVVTKAGMIDYAIDNASLLLTQDAPWQDSVLAKTASLSTVQFSLAVDANRNGQIKVASEDISDFTFIDKPFRFWSNDDDDVDDNDPDDSEVAPVVSADWLDDKIDGIRDLEDFSRLKIHLGGLQDALRQGQIRVGLKWKGAPGSTGAAGIKVWRNLSPNGGTEYLTNVNVAQQHLALNGPGTIQGALSYIIPTQYWTDVGLSESQPYGNLLFEGISAGKDQLVITLHKADGTEIGEGPGVWFDLKNIKSMYERVKATADGAENFPLPYNHVGSDPVLAPAMGWTSDPNGFPFEPAPGESATCIVSVHGWNQTYERSTMYAETMFKRMWHRGYKGRFVRFRWPTFTGLTTYNDSEYRAWKCGASLKQYLDTLPSTYTVNLVAHSMGNIVAGSALEKGASVANYALLNAAVPAICYDTSGNVVQTSWGYVTPNDDPDSATVALSYQGRLAGVSGRLVNFFLPTDSALKAWEINNDSPSGARFFPLRGFKPHQWLEATITAGYRYQRTAAASQKLRVVRVAGERTLNSPDEAMGFAVQSPSLTVGADGRTRGSIVNSVDMTAFSFDREHSAEFMFPIQKTETFYESLLLELRVSTGL